MKQNFKQRATKKPINIDPPTDHEKFISSDSKRFYRNVCTDLKVVHGRTIQKSKEVLSLHSPLTVRFRRFLRHQWGSFRGSSQTLLRESCHSRSLQKVVNQFSNPIFWILVISVRFWTFPMKVTMFVSLLMTSCLPLANQIDVYSLILFDGEKSNTATCLKPDFQVISKWFVGSVVPRGGHNDFPYPLQAILLYSPITDWKINIGHIIFGSIRATYANITAPTHS